VKALLDTNLVIDYPGGIPQVRDEIALYTAPVISQITWMEVLVGARDDREMTRLQGFLARYERVSIDDRVSEIAVALRRERRIRLPDAIIWASARQCDAILVTRNTRDFPEADPGIRVPY